MSYRDIEALKERIRTARENGRPTRKGKSALSAAEKAQYCQNLVEADVAFKEAHVNRDAVTWQAYKAGLPISLMAESLGVAEATLYERLKVLRKTLGIKKTR